MARSELLTEKLKSLPTNSGCYLMKDEAGTIIYVGKAVNLRNRVRSYFQKSSALTPKVRRLVARIVDLDVIVTDSELEALILECNLIKEHKPHYNVRLRDDKQYPYLVLTTSEPFPRLLITRRVRRGDGNRYFGPYTSSKAVWETLRLIYRLFPLVTCRKQWDNRPVQRPCLYHHMGRCTQAPCAGKADPAAYQAAVSDVALFLEGKQDILMRKLRADMEAAADALEFERAARLRDQIQAVETLVERQKVVSTRSADQDVVALVTDQGLTAVQMFFVRGGKLIGQEHFLLDGLESDDDLEEATAEFIKQYYQEANYVPSEVLVNTRIEESEIIEQWLRGKRGTKVTIAAPERGDKKSLLEMAASNARLAIDQMLQRTATENDRIMHALAELQEVVALDDPPERIEAYDISTIQGRYSVGGMVVFERGKPAKAEYRRFRIQMPETTGEPNDFAMMREVILRRLTAASKGDPKFTRLPDLMLIDGGKGQLSSAMEAAAEAGAPQIAMIGLAKQFELIFRPGESVPIALSRNSQALMLLLRIRDEVHRYSVTYHRNVRGKNSLVSVLDTVSGIGPARRRELLRTFGSVDMMKQATVDEIAGVPSMNRKSAEAVYNILHVPDTQGVGA
ncbi:MAG: excinuclease ABC subunit UvrC [Capsulimonadaceae bacterium]|nr:excinuclease ABC subunit UvrC [Capsulimonadaceae bacterium]